MKIQKFVCAAIAALAMGLFGSCDKNDVTEDENLFHATEKKSIGRDEVKLQDT